MRRVSMVFAALCMLLLCHYESCFAGPLSTMEIVRQDAEILLHPWVTTLLLTVGMLLIISEMAIACGWGAAGVAGVLCVSSVIASCAIAGLASVGGLVLLLLGLFLLVAEAHILRGYGISALAGLASIFLGTYWTFGGPVMGTSYALAMSLLVTLMSFFALLAHISRNHAWLELSHKAHVARSARSSTESVEKHVETSQVGAVSVIPVTPSNTAVRENRTSYAARSDVSLSPSVAGLAILQRMQARMDQLKVSSVPLVTECMVLECRIEVVRARLARIDADVRRAVANGTDDLAKDMIMQKDACCAQLEELQRQLRERRRRADAAALEIEDFRREMHNAQRRIDDAAARTQLAAMAKLFNNLISPEAAALERIEERADSACAEAESYGGGDIADKAAQLAARKKRAERALADLKAELRQSEPSHPQQIVGQGHPGDPQE